MPGISFSVLDRVAYLGLNRPEKKNALGGEELQSLSQLLQQIQRSRDIDIVILDAVGDYFCAGVDLAYMSEVPGTELTVAVRQNALMVESFERLPQLTIASLAGPALGLGAHLALGADFPVLSDHAYLRFPEGRLGWPDITHFDLLERRLGYSSALDMLLRGVKLDAHDAVQAGLAHSVYARSALPEAVQVLVAELKEVSAPVRHTLKQRRVDSLLSSTVEAQAQAFANLSP